MPNAMSVMSDTAEHSCVASASPKLEILHDLVGRKWYHFPSYRLEACLGNGTGADPAPSCKATSSTAIALLHSLHGWSGAPTGPPRQSEHGHCRKRTRHLREASQVV